MNYGTSISKTIGLALGAAICAAFLITAVPLLSNTLASAFNPAFSAFAPSVAYADDYGDWGWEGGDCCGGGSDGSGGGYDDWGWEGGDCCSNDYQPIDYGYQPYDYGYQPIDYSYNPTTYYQPYNPPPYNPPPQYCPSGYSGTYPNCIPPPQHCPGGYTGVYPNCVPPPQYCPSGYTGTYPNCVPPPQYCPSGYTGTYPNCVPPPQYCPSGYSGTYPYCVPPPPPPPPCYNCYIPPPPQYCPSGYSGTYPNCFAPQPFVYTTYTPNVSLYQGPTAQPLAAVSLSQIPYTGLDLGPWGTFIYWSVLVLLSAIAAYLIAVKKIFSGLTAKLRYFLLGDMSVATHPAYTQSHGLTASAHAQAGVVGVPMNHIAHAALPAATFAAQAGPAPTAAHVLPHLDAQTLAHLFAEALAAHAAKTVPVSTAPVPAAPAPFKDTTDDFVLAQVNRLGKR